MLSENKFSKYLLYAIGEIILVVVGILLALYINNWNEGEKLQETEFKTLTGIHEDLIATLKDIEDDTHLNQLSLKSALNIKKYINENKTLTDSLIIDF